MSKSVNFKLERDGGIYHCFSLQVICKKIFDSSDKISYCVEALTHGRVVPITIFPIYDTVEEAFEFVEEIAKKYPRYNDDRDFDISLAPEYKDDNYIG